MAERREHTWDYHCGTVVCRKCGISKSFAEYRNTECQPVSLEAGRCNFSYPGESPADAIGRINLVAGQVDRPPHYTGHPSGIECIQVTEHLNFCLGNAIKYIWRADLKGNAVQDLEKARWYIDREIARRKINGN